MLDFRTPSEESVTKYFSQKTSSLGMTHFLAAECSCSQHLISYFIKRKKLPNVSEKIVLIGSSPEEEVLLKDAGFEVQNIDPEEAKHSDAFSAVPLLIVHEQETVLYTGGYTNGAITPLSHFADIEVFGAIKNKDSTESFPVKGCAVAKTFQKALDPLGLKYRSTSL